MRLLALLTITASLGAAGCGASPLHVAIQRKDFPEVQRLVESGADIDKRAGLIPDTMPLPWAVLHGTPEIVKYLLKKGARGQVVAMVNAANPNSPEMFDVLFDNGVKFLRRSPRKHT